jgi:hypothetical protein
MMDTTAGLLYLRGASSFSHTARQVSSLSNATANPNIPRATRVRSALQNDFRGASRASRRSSASILAFFSCVSAPENHSCMPHISLPGLPHESTGESGQDTS